MILDLHVQPGGGRLKLRLAAPPVDGKANEALVAFLAEYYGVPKRNVRILAGASSRRKRILIEGARWTATKNKT